MWEYLSSQQVIDIYFKVSEGKELSDIGEMLCDYCLAPNHNLQSCNCDKCINIYDWDDDVTSIGFDNMTVVIIAILNGRTNEEWYTWVSNCVQWKHGYETPSSLPSLYPQDG